MFEKANRMKLRFTSLAGQLAVEDLWDLPLTSKAGKANLDDLAKGLFRELKDSNEISFVTPSESGGKTTQLKFDIVKHIIDVRLAENAAAMSAQKVKDQKQAILSIIAQKENDALGSKPIEELQKMVDSM